VSTATIEALELTKTYDEGVRAVNGVSFAVAAGESLGLLGPNGAGKTTTIGMLNTSVVPSSGSARLGGINVAEDPLGTRSISSVVFQDAVVDPPLTGRQNLELHLRLWDVEADVGRRRLKTLSELAGISHLLNRAVSTYSGGERRRLEIVRALLSDPKVLFLDEPTVGLDTRVRHDLFDALSTLREHTGVTVLMTTHYLDEAERLCDRIAIIDHGEITACDTPGALIQSVGPAVLEVRVSDPQMASRVLERMGVSGGDVLIIGSTVTVSLRSASAEGVVQRLRGDGISLSAVTTRDPSLDDAYLRLTDDHQTA
jgi:ABC-2 type transport system ATP-binding protein